MAHIIDLLRDLIRSPMVRAYALAMALLLASFAVVEPSIIIDVLDCFVMAAAICAAVRFSPPVLTSMRQRDPQPYDILLMGILGVVVGEGLTRSLRQIGVEFGFVAVRDLPHLFAIFTALVVFSVFMLVFAPPFQRGTVRLSPFATLAITLVIGASLSIVVLALRWWW